MQWHDGRGTKRRLEPAPFRHITPGPARAVRVRLESRAPAFNGPQQQAAQQQHVHLEAWDRWFPGARATLMAALASMDCSIQEWVAKCSAAGLVLRRCEHIIELAGPGFVDGLIALFLPDYPRMRLLVLDEVSQRLPQHAFISPLQMPTGCKAQLLDTQTDDQLQCSSGVVHALQNVKVGPTARRDPDLVEDIKKDAKAISKAQLHKNIECSLTRFAVRMLELMQQRAKWGATAAAYSRATLAQVVMDHVLGMAHVAMTVCNMHNMLDILEEER